MKTLNILSIDGGGVKGFYTLYILNEIEKKFCIPNNKLLSDYFKIICGCSIGSAIATHIALRRPISKMIEFMEKKESNFFSNSDTNTYPVVKQINSMMANIKQLFGKKYDNINLKLSLIELFGNKSMKDVHNVLCIPSYSITDSQNCVFKNKMIEAENYNKYNHFKLVDIIMASSSAPSYFEPYKIQDKYYVDGGLWANNPSMIGIIEALKYYVGPDKEYETYRLLSVGNINYDIKINKDSCEYYFNISTIVDFVSIILNSNRDSIRYYSEKLNNDEANKRIHLRIENNSENEIDLDNVSTDIIKQIKNIALTDINNILQDKTNNIYKFF